MQDQGSTNPEAIDKAKQEAESQVDRIIDEFAGKVPGGANLSPQAKEKANEAIENLEEEAKKRFGGLFGRH
jgi:hypothetical protein